MTSINWGQFLSDHLPVRLRTAEVKAFFESFMASVNWLYTQFVNYRSLSRTSVDYKLAHTSQVWSIEAVLNDEFDPVERRIYIMDTDDYEAIFLQPDDDQLPVYIDTDVFSDLLIYPDSSYSESGFDFLVVLPYAFAESDIYQLKALVNYYKLAGVRYDIVVIETI